MLNKERIREINELRVRCSQLERGCTWEGELGAMKPHLHSCGYVTVECDQCGIVAEEFFVSDRASMFALKEKKCGAVVVKRNLKQHKEEECLYRPYRCAHCNYSDTYDAIAGSGRVTKEDTQVKGGRNHYEQCTQYPLECPNKCGAKSIKRKNLGTHRAKCPQEPVKCPFGGEACLGKVTRTNVDSHKDDCDFRPYTCEYCGTKGTFSSITGEESLKFYGLLQTCHYDECAEYPFECPSGCGETLRRKDATAHKATCPMEHADCPFSHVGCTTKLPQREMDGHCRDSMQEHLLLLAKSHRELSDANKELARENGELCLQNGELTARCIEMEGKLDLNYMSLSGQIDMVREELSAECDGLEDRILDTLAATSGSSSSTSSSASSSTRGGQRGQNRGGRGNRRRGRQPAY